MSSENEPARTSPFGHPTVAEAQAEVAHEKQLLARDGVVMGAATDRRPEPLLRFLAGPFLDLGMYIAEAFEPGPERTLSLRALISSQDDAGRCKAALR